MRGRRVAVATVAAALALAFGCLDFEERTLVFEHDAERDSLTVVIDYRGFLVGSEEAEGTAFYKLDLYQAQLQLDRAVLNRSFAVFANWPVTLDMPRLRETGVPEDWAEPLIRARINDFVRGVEILNAGFYRDSAGRACGTQVITIENASEGIDLANQFLSRQIRSALLQRLRGRGGDDLRSQIPTYLMPYVERGPRWIELDEGSVTLNLPLSDAMPEEDRLQLLGGVFLASEDNLSEEPQEFTDRLGNGVVLQRKGDVLSATYPAEMGVVRLKSRRSAGAASPELRAHVEQKHGFGLDIALARCLAGIGVEGRGERERAAQLIAPLLPPRDRLRVLLHAAEKQQLPQFWDALRKEAAAQSPDADLADMPREGLAAHCHRLLAGAAGPD